EPIQVFVPLKDDSLVGRANPGSRFGQRIEHCLQIEGRTADDLEHVGSGGLLLQRLPQFVEQPRVLDGDDGLGGEIRQQLDLFGCEWSNLLAKDAESADEFILLK